MGFLSFARKRKAADQADVASEVKGGSWLDSERSYDDRMMRQAVSTRNWQRAWFGQFVFSLLMLGVVVYALQIPKYHPVPIAIDKLGRSAVVRDSSPDAALLAKQEFTEVGDFIENCRTVLGDKMGLRRLQARCYSRLPDESAARRWYVDQTQDSNSPFTIGEKYSVEPTVTNRLKLSEGNWEVEWNDQTIDLNGAKVGPPIHYKGHMSIEFLRGTDSMKQLEQNPNGFYVQRLTWAKRM